MMQHEIRIAIVDDDPIVCSSIGTIITATHTGQVCWTAHDGQSAIDHYAQERPDVLLIDVQMQGMDGLVAAQRILQDDPQARILVLTTFADPEYIAQAIAIGTRGYLIKQDVAQVIPALHAVMAEQVVLGAEVLAHLPTAHEPHAQPQSVEQSSRFVGLTERERAIVVLVAQGLDNREIAAKLFLSEGTVRNRISDILAKTNLGNRTKLAVEWLAYH